MTVFKNILITIISIELVSFVILYVLSQALKNLFWEADQRLHQFAEGTNGKKTVKNSSSRGQKRQPENLLH